MWQDHFEVKRNSDGRVVAIGAHDPEIQKRLRGALEQIGALPPNSSFEDKDRIFEGALGPELACELAKCFANKPR
jgi:hypothetical protein